MCTRLQNTPTRTLLWAELARAASQLSRQSSAPLPTADPSSRARFRWGSTSVALSQSSFSSKKKTAVETLLEPGCCSTSRARLRMDRRACVMSIWRRARPSSSTAPLAPAAKLQPLAASRLPPTAYRQLLAASRLPPAACRPARPPPAAERPRSISSAASVCGAERNGALSASNRSLHSAL